MMYFFEAVIILDLHSNIVVNIFDRNNVECRLINYHFKVFVRKNRLQEQPKPVVSIIFQASAGREMDQNKGLRLLL